MSEPQRWPSPTAHPYVSSESPPGQIRPTFAWVAFAFAMIGAVPVLGLGALLLLFRQVGCGYGETGCNDPFWLWLAAGVLATVIVPVVAMALTRNTRSTAINAGLVIVMFIPLLGWFALFTAS